MSDKINPIFIQNILKKSLSTDINIAKKEWEYCGQVKHLIPIQSTCFNNPEKVIHNSVAFYNFRTNEIFHSNTSKIQYFLHCKGKNRKKIVETNPLGNGEGNDINNGLLSKINTFVESIYHKHNQNKVIVGDIRQLYKYKFFLTNIKIEQQEQLNNILFKINWLINNFYKINYCETCQDFYLSKVKQSEFRPKCLNCYTSNDVCFLKLINKI